MFRNDRDMNAAALPVENFALDKESFAARMTGALPHGIVKSPENFSDLDFTVEDPMNMKAVDTLVFNAAMDMRRYMHPEGTLYVVLSERHARPSHVMTQTGLVDNITDAYVSGGQDSSLRSVFGIELPYNDLSYHLQDAYNLSITPAQRKFLHLHDPLGHIFTRAAMAKKYMGEMTPYTRNQRFAAILRNKTPLVLIDAAQKGYFVSYLDECDEMAAEIADNLYKIDLACEDVLTNTSAIGHTRGVVIRNGVMAKRLKAAAKDAGIVIAGTGINHLGNERKSLGFKTSLPYFLAEETGPHDRILTIFLASARDGLTPENITSEGNHDKITSMMVRGLTDTKYDEVNEKDFSLALGASYGHNIPQRFYPPDIPSPSDMYEELKHLLASHSCAI
ncbi:MAG: hypothetical protein R3E13_11735 [Alphaproteobacteria bacterium]